MKWMGVVNPVLASGTSGVGFQRILGGQQDTQALGTGDRAGFTCSQSSGHVKTRSLTPWEIKEKKSSLLGTEGATESET